MKNLLTLIILSQAALGLGAAENNGSPSTNTVVERGAHRRVWQRDDFITLNDGRVINRPHRTIELSSGLHYRNAQGEWTESRDEIAVTAEGAAATNGPHKVHFTANVNNAGTVSVTTPEGTSLKTHVIGLAYTGNGQSVLFAPIRNSEGLLFPPNQVLYPAAFAGGILADVRLSYTKAGLESDVILRTRLPSPADWNLNEEEVLLQVWHEIDEAPEPVITQRTRRAEVDSTISFGAMALVRGGAFALDTPLSRMSGAPVGKTWVKDGNRTFLIESVRYKAIKAELEQLPPPQAAVEKPATRIPRMAARIGPGGAGLAKLVAPAEAQATARPLRLALDTKALDRRQGLVLDYVLVNVETNPITLAADQTYYIPDQIYATDVVIEGGTVVKYEPDAFIFVNAAIDCRTSAHHPAIFTAKDDDTAGEKISGSTGTPSGNYAGGTLLLEQAGNTLHDLRISYALWGLVVDYDSTLRHLQFVHCHSAIQLSFCTLTLDNSLFYDADRVFFGGYDSVVEARHLTGHRVRDLVWAPDDLFALNLTNSLLVNVTNWGTALYYTNAVVKTADEATLQTVGAGAHYLADASAYRNAGTTNIPSTLLSDLRQRSTYPPTVITNAILAANLTLALIAPRGTNTPDLGYAYAPLDYVFGSNVLTNATLTLTSGVVLGTFTPGSNTHSLLLLSGANVIGSGQPTNLVRVVRYNMVQEQASAAWSAVYPGAQLRIPNHHVASAPAGNFRFTDWSVPEGSPWHLDLAPTNRTAFVFRDCQFTAGRFFASVAQVAFTNCLFHRVNGWAEEYPLVVTNQWYHNTAEGGTWTFFNSMCGPWGVFNNAFRDTADLGADCGLPHGWNACLPGAPLVSGWLSNGIVTNIAFQSGPLGDFYLPSTSPLLNRGTNTAADFGLYHFTSTTNQVKETNSTADIGFHYVALNAANRPVDADADGLPDYTEDVNGNGVRDTSETDVANSDTDYDGRPDGQEVLSDGTNPLDGTSVVFSRLAYFPFNDTNWLGSAGQSPLSSSNAVSQNAWVSKGLQIDTAPTAFLKYRDVESDLSANLNLRQGAVRFWFKSAWDTGLGTSNQARLIEVGSKGGASTNGWWSLYFSQTNGTQISFAAETNNAGAIYLTGTVSWQHCDWNQLVLNYTTTNSALYLNSSLVSTGLGVTYWPGASVRASGFTTGSDANGTNQARGLFEDLETFNYPLGTNEIAENFQTNRPPNAIADLKMWLKADADVSFGIGPKILTWADQTCNRFNADQSSPNKQPLFSPNELNGRPAVRFYTTNYFTLPDMAASWTQAEAFVILKAELDFPADPRALWCLYGNTAAEYYPHTNGTIGDDFGRGGSVLNVPLTPSASIAQPHLYHVITKPDEWTSRINGVVHYSTLTNTVSWANGQRYLGRNQQENNFHGFIAEVLIYNRVLTVPERKRVEVYLNQRYALVANSPPSPSNLVVHGVSPTQMSVTWDATLENTNVNFTLERKTNGGNFVIVTALDNAASFVDTALQTNTTYTYRVKAENWAGSSAYSAEASANTLASGSDVPFSSLKLWLKSDTGHGAGSLAFWVDQSGNGLHAFQSSHGLQPVQVLNGVATNKPTIGFYTSNYFALGTDRFAWSAVEGYFAWRVHQYPAPANTAREQYKLGTLALTYPETNGAISDNFFREGARSVAAASVTNLVSLTNFHLYNPFSTTNFWTNRLNTVQLDADTGNMFYSAPSPRLGALGEHPWDGEIAEILFFDRALTTSERATVENYLNHRYSLW